MRRRGSREQGPVDPDLSRKRAEAARRMHMLHAPSVTTRAGQRAFQRRFEAEAIANGAKTERDIKTMAANARASYYATLSRIGVEARNQVARKKRVAA
jgi:hypothetical protein